MDILPKQRGVFFMSDTPDQKLKGSLSFSQEDGGFLEIDGVFDQTLKRVFNYSVIHGELSDGTLVTLFDCLVKSFPSFQTSTSNCSYIVNFIVEGGQYCTKEEVILHSLKIEYSNLSDWIMIHGFQFSKNFSDKKFSVDYTLPKPIELYKTSEYNLSICFSASLPRLEHVQKEAAITQETYFLIESESMKLDASLSISYDIENFLSFAMITKRKIAYPKKIYGTTKDDARIQIYYKLASKDDKEISWFDMLFTYPQIKEQFPKLISTWLTKADLLRPVYGLFLGIVYEPKLLIEKKFLNLIHSLEVFHRRTRYGLDLPKEEHENRLRSIYEQLVNNEHLSWLKEKLIFSNEISLRSRLQQLLAEFPILEEYLGDKKDKFISKVVRTRNYYTHYDKQLEKKALKGIDLFEIQKELQILILGCLLKEIGFNTDLTSELMERYARSIGIKLKSTSEEDLLKNADEYLQELGSPTDN
ncbi:hypothetical protein EHV15_10225 [Paenibacillus oralis]|uniref:Uncharacterized protein n=1 Tax=Paenibacillus oralis TaxID=2490856 RepID=A0A3P3U3U0_9BACL|nr:HEPN domain-containing protein [Paenibacillus oralis]RRJ63253.1 hypothetical protein EHV15_10225 [Paenibacillus oralis]